MSDNTQELRSILGEIPNYIFEYLELSDDIKKEWKLGSKASDFGGHNQFVQKFSKRIEALLLREREKEVKGLRNWFEEHFNWGKKLSDSVYVTESELEGYIKSRLAELSRLSEEPTHE